MVLQRDQGAHHMCIVDDFTRLALDHALWRRWRQGSTVGYGVGGQYAEGSRDFKYGVYVYSLEAKNDNVYSFEKQKYLVGGDHLGCL